MAIYPGARSVIQSGAALGTSQKYADASARKAQDVRRSRESAATAKERVSQVEQTIESSGLRGDDGIPPGYPTVTAEAFFHQVDLYWPRPPASDEVVGSLVRIRPENEASRIVSRPSHSATIKNLPHKPHTFEVLLFDKWGRESLWSDAVTATPLLTAAEEIDLGEIAMLGRLRGLLPNTNLATIEDATKLADELIESGKIAPGAITGPKLPEGVVTGPKIADEAVTGPKIPNDAITGPKIAAGSVVADKIGANAVTTVKLDAGAVVADKIASGEITTPKLAAGAVVADKIGANEVRARELAADAIHTRHITAGAVTASVMAAQDAAAFNLWAQNAMIRSAAIQSITADKITAGQMTAGTITLAGGGAILAGRTILNSRGLSLPALPGGTATLIPENQDYKITNDAGTGGLYFRAPTSAGNAHSTVLQGDSSPNQRGMVWLAGMANTSDWDHPSNALVRVGSYRPDSADPSFIDCFGANATYAGRWFAQLYAREGNANVISYGGNIRLITDGDISLGSRLLPAALSPSVTLPAKSRTSYPHNFGKRPLLTMGWLHRGSGEFAPLPTSPASGGIDVFVDYVSTTHVGLRNESNSAFTLSVMVF